jgi:hypothetical protein
MRSIKEWIDSDEMAEFLLEKLKAFGNFGFHDKIRVRQQIFESVTQEAAVSLLLNWMIVSEIWMNYIAESPEQPLGKVKNIWYRHEFQDCQGNLSHIHALIWVEKTQSLYKQH